MSEELPVAKAPNVADLRTMAAVGYPVRLSPAWLTWLVSQLDELERLREITDRAR
jgi:hypothetical protein